MAPSHITGATTGAARRFAPTETTDRRPKCRATSGAVPDRRRERERQRVGDRPRHDPAQREREGADPTANSA